MTWIIFAVSSYFFSAASQVVDKVLLRTRLPSPATYAFYTGVSSALVVIVLPFGGAILPIATLFLALVAGIVFVPALYLLYVSFKRCDISRVIPIVGGATPIFLLIISFVWLRQPLYIHQVYAFALFILGGLLLAFEVYQTNATDTFFMHIIGAKGRRLQICNYETGKGIGAAVFSAFFFALTYFLSKIVYQSPAHFIPEFFWIRIGSAIGALAMLVIPVVRREIFATTPTISKSSASFLFGNKIMGAFGFFLLNLSFSAAYDQSYIVIINAMKGLEHVFVFIFSLFLTVFYPRILQEKFDYHTIVLKIIGIALIGLGFVFIV